MIGATLTPAQQSNGVKMFTGIRDTFANSGYSGMLPILIACMAAYESNNFTSHVYTVDNNATGIVWINNPKIQPATKGLPRPKSEGGYYAHYGTINLWAVDMMRIVKKMFPSKSWAWGAPGEPTTAFAKILKQKGYYTGNESTYAAGLKTMWNRYVDASDQFRVKLNADKQTATNNAATNERNNMLDTVKTMATGVNVPAVPGSAFNPSNWGIKEWGIAALVTAFLLSRR